MVSATRAPNTAAVLEYRWAPRIVSRFWIDRSHHRLVLEQAAAQRDAAQRDAAQRDAAQRDAAQRDAACRFPPIWLCCLVRPGRDGMGGIVVLSADHQLPGDAGHPRPARGRLCWPAPRRRAWAICA